MRKTALILLITILYINKTEAQTSVLSVADSLLQSGNYIAAIEKLDSYYPQTFETLVKQGYIFQITGNYSKSISSYNEALSKGESVKVTQSLGKSYQLQGNANKAIELYEEVLEKDSTNLILKYNLAKIYTKERKSKDAIKLLNELIKADSLNPNYHYSLGKIHQNKGASGFMKSGNYFLSAFKVDSSHLKSIYELTKFYKKIHFKDSATLFINKGLKKYPESINFNQSKAKDLFYRKEYDSTLVYLKRLEDLNYKTMFTYKLYGLTYMKMEDYNNAEKYFKKARKINWNDDQVYYYLGLIDKQNGDLKGATINFTMSIMKLKPDIDKQLFELGSIYLEQKDLQKAVKYFKESYENNRGNYLALFQLASASDDYYKDKKISLKYYEIFVKKSTLKDEKMFEYATKRVKEIKKELFMEGVKIE